MEKITKEKNAPRKNDEINERNYIRMNRSRMQSKHIAQLLSSERSFSVSHLWTRVVGAGGAFNLTRVGRVTNDIPLWSVNFVSFHLKFFICSLLQHLVPIVAAAPVIIIIIIINHDHYHRCDYVLCANAFIFDCLSFSHLSRSQHMRCEYSFCYLFDSNRLFCWTFVYSY